jgi:hypothetical protein
MTTASRSIESASGSIGISCSNDLAASDGQYLTPTHMKTSPMYINLHIHIYMYIYMYT